MAVLTSGMEFIRKYKALLVFASLSGAMGALCFCGRTGIRQHAPRRILDRLNAMMAGGKSAWTPDQLATMERLRDAAMKDPYALDELRHLTDNIGPRLSGSPQAQQAVEYVAAEMRALGAEVTLEKATGAALGARRGDGRSWSLAGADAGHDAESCADGAGRKRGDAAGGDHCGSCCC